MMRVLLALVVLSLSSLLGVVSSARAQERNFAGSAQFNYLLVPEDAEARTHSLDGFTTEIALKLAIDFGDHVSTNVKLCYGCHGVEVDMAFADVRVSDELNFRVGRFNPAFGEFPLRHDPANHRTNDKPLVYDMGRMLQRVGWNMSVLPSPYVDTGVEVNGTHWFGEDAQLDYAAYLVSGFRGNQEDIDFDFIQSRTPASYYVDNNSRPSVGGRVALTLNLSEETLLAAGLSGMFGQYDPAAERDYWIIGADVSARIGKLDLRAEYLLRRTEMALGRDPDQRFRYGPGQDGTYDDFFLKDGFYVEGTYAFSQLLEVVARFDGMRRIGNVLQGSPLRSRSAILRYTAGVNLILERALRFKLSGEFYDFSDFEDALAFNAAAVVIF